jgi:hypothetical protein
MTMHRCSIDRRRFMQSAAAIPAPLFFSPLLSKRRSFLEGARNLSSSYGPVCFGKAVGDQQIVGIAEAAAKQLGLHDCNLEQTAEMIFGPISFTDDSWRGHWPYDIVKTEYRQKQIVWCDGWILSITEATAIWVIVRQRSLLDMQELAA